MSQSTLAAAKRSAEKSQSLLDQSALTDLAQRLVEAAKRAGADAADAIAVRGVSQSVEIRDGNVEESERAEGDDVGLRVLIGHKQAVVSTNDIVADVAHARRARGRHGADRAGGQVRGPCRSFAAGEAISRSSTCSIPMFRRSRSSNGARARPKPRALR